MPSPLSFFPQLGAIPGARGLSGYYGGSSPFGQLGYYGYSDPLRSPGAGRLPPVLGILDRPNIDETVLSGIQDFAPNLPLAPWFQTLGVKPPDWSFQSPLAIREQERQKQEQAASRPPIIYNQSKAKPAQPITGGMLGNEADFLPPTIAPQTINQPTAVGGGATGGSTAPSDVIPIPGGFVKWGRPDIPLTPDIIAQVQAQHQAGPGVSAAPKPPPAPGTDLISPMDITEMLGDESKGTPLPANLNANYWLKG